ncbi:hypothetical protein GFY24_31940 [Nocardia sp. SYP-A9097]|uniref:hypothetical protein n=1 Tax=Nocardia sp. SYP-A9097 TaxID=2663237 RepID=UPI00129A1FF3|nr:hypothetical protein [Nocardia sp. SYP-A9097]MRH91997.1 hypothetical protein [Nocardia sp. SYP-A9097]
MVASPAHAADPEGARLAGCDFGVAVSTYDYRIIDSYINDILDRTTGEFREKFQSGTDGLRGAIVDAHAHSEAKKVQCTLLSGDSEHAEITLESDIVLTSDVAGHPPRSFHTTSTHGVDNVDGRWLISSTS